MEPDLPVQCQVITLNVHAWNRFSQINLKKCPSKRCFYCFTVATRWPDTPKNDQHIGVLKILLSKIHQSVFAYLVVRRMGIMLACTHQYVYCTLTKIKSMLLQNLMIDRKLNASVLPPQFLKHCKGLGAQIPLCVCSSLPVTLLPSQSRSWLEPVFPSASKGTQVRFGISLVTSKEFSL